MMAENQWNLTKDINLQILGVQQFLNMINARKPRHIIIKLLKAKYEKKKNLDGTQEKRPITFMEL